MSKVLIVGRENVGKSTLFNLISPQQKAIAYDYPGVTRDFKETPVTWMNFSFDLIDAPGFKDSMIDLPEVDLILFVVDGTQLPDETTRQLAQHVRKLGKPVVLLVNKSDRKDCDPYAFYALGFQHVLLISAAHNQGLHDLVPFFEAHLQPPSSEDRENLYRIAIMGRPNAGKSTLINTYLGYQRQLTGEQPGVTRDSVEIPFTYKERKVTLIDTSGIRRKSRVQDPLERMTVQSSLQAMHQAHGIIYLMDATELSPYELPHQDLILMQKVLQEGRCLCIGLNKWDQIRNPNLLDDVRYQIQQKLLEIPFVTISAHRRTNVDQLLDQMLQTLDHYDQRIPTGQLNRWFRELPQRPPSSGGQVTKIKYLTQASSRPPTFALSANRHHPHLQSYERYLKRQLSRAFHLEGIPIRLHWKIPKNPYEAEQ